MVGTRAAFAAFALAAWLAAPAATRAEDTAPPAVDAARVGRYTMVPAEGGFVRLDTETGVISHCRRESAAADAGWRCAAIPEAVLDEPDRTSALAARVDALEAEVARLKGRLDTPPAVSSGDPEFDRAVGVGEEVMRRFLGLMREMKGDGTSPRTDPVRP